MKTKLNTKTRMLSFTFKGEDFTIDLNFGDLHDNWGSIVLSDGIMYDTNFTWELKPQLSLYRCGDAEQQYDDTTLITDITVLGSKADYFNLEFDKNLVDFFILFSAGGEVKMMTKSLNTLVDRKEKGGYIVTVDKNMSIKTIY